MIPYGYVYLIRNTVNNKTYVGLRKLSKDKYWRQYMGSGKLIKQAIAKYGEDLFVKSLIGYSYSQKELYDLEKETIISMKLKGTAEYNLSIHTPYSGNYYSLSDEGKKLKSERLSKSISESCSDPDYVSGSSKLFELRYKEFELSTSPEEVINLYKDLSNMRAVATYFGTSYRVIRRYIISYNIPIENRTIKGFKRPESEKDSISLSLKSKHSSDPAPRRVCSGQCDRVITEHNKSGMCSKCKSKLPEESAYDILNLLETVPNISFREIGRRTGLSKDRVRRFVHSLT